jgi:hypothetical protein
MEMFKVLSYFCSLESEKFFHNGIHPKFEAVHTIPQEGEVVRNNNFLTIHLYVFTSTNM